MTCAVENYQPIFYKYPFSQDDSVFLETAWLRTDVYDDEFELHRCKSPTAVSFFNCQKARTASIAAEARAPAWWESELAVSIHDTLKRKEDKLKIEMKSPQLAFRTEMVDYIRAVCRNLDISIGTRHTAVRLMDYFMDGHNVMYYRLRLVALTCLLIAAKFEERDDCIPTIESLHYSSRLVDSTTSFMAEEINALELYALKFFKWNVSRPGIAHFIDYYHHVSTKWENKVLATQLHNFNFGLMEAALREQQFLYHDPSKIAAAIICVTRICSQMERVWTPELETVSTYSLEVIQPLAAVFLKLYDDWKVDMTT